MRRRRTAEDRYRPTTPVNKAKPIIERVRNEKIAVSSYPDAPRTIQVRVGCNNLIIGRSLVRADNRVDTLRCDLSPGLRHSAARSVHIPDMRIGRWRYQARIWNEESCCVGSKLDYLLRLAARHAEPRGERRTTVTARWIRVVHMQNPDESPATIVTDPFVVMRATR